MNPSSSYFSCSLKAKAITELLWRVIMWTFESGLGRPVGEGDDQDNPLSQDQLWNICPYDRQFIVRFTAGRKGGELSLKSVGAVNTFPTWIWEEMSQLQLRKVLTKMKMLDQSMKTVQERYNTCCARDRKSIRRRPACKSATVFSMSQVIGCLNSPCFDQDTAIHF